MVVIIPFLCLFTRKAPTGSLPPAVIPVTPKTRPTKSPVVAEIPFQPTTDLQVIVTPKIDRTKKKHLYHFVGAVSLFYHFAG